MAKAKKQNTPASGAVKSTIMLAAEKLDQCWKSMDKTDEDESKDRDRRHLYEARKKHLSDAIGMLEKQILLSQAQSPTDAYVQVSIALSHLDFIGDGENSENSEIIRELERVMNSLMVWLECQSGFEDWAGAKLYTNDQEDALTTIAKAGLVEATIHG